MWPRKEDVAGHVAVGAEVRLVHVGALEEQVELSQSLPFALVGVLRLRTEHARRVDHPARLVPLPDGRLGELAPTIHGTIERLWRLGEDLTERVRGEPAERAVRRAYNHLAAARWSSKPRNGPASAAPRQRRFPRQINETEG